MVDGVGKATGAGGGFTAEAELDVAVVGDDFGSSQPRTQTSDASAKTEQKRSILRVVTRLSEGVKLLSADVRRDKMRAISEISVGRQ
jgi:hypothetical protein